MHRPDLGPGNCLLEHALGPGADRDQNAAIFKDEDRCIRCALCVQRCPADAIAMERVETTWKTTV